MEPNVDRGMWSVVVLLSSIVIGGVVLLAFPQISGKIANNMDATVNKAFSGELPDWVVEQNKEDKEPENEMKTYKDLLYKEYDEYVEIHGYDKKSPEFSNSNTKLTIPDHIHGKPVTIIAYKAFSEENVTELALGENVETISGYAFNRTKIQEFVANDKLKFLRGGSFERVPLIKIKLNEGLETISWYSFYGHKTSIVDIPSTVKMIDERAFNSKYMDEVIMNKNVKFVGQDKSKPSFHERTIIKYK